MKVDLKIIDLDIMRTMMNHCQDEIGNDYHLMLKLPPDDKQGSCSGPIERVAWSVGRVENSKNEI